MVMREEMDLRIEGIEGIYEVDMQCIVTQIPRYPIQAC